MNRKTLVLLFAIPLLLTRCFFDNNKVVGEGTPIVHDGKNPVLSVRTGNDDCIPVILLLYEDNTFELYTTHLVCRSNDACDDLAVNYIKSVKGTYDYDIKKIIKASVDAENQSYSQKGIPEYLITDRWFHDYVVENGSENIYLNELLEQINVNLKRCATAEYYK